MQDFELALKELPEGTYFEHGAHTTVEDLCFVCLHELDLHAECEYFHPVAMRRAYLKFIEKHGFYVMEAQAVFKQGLRRSYRDFPHYESQ